MTRLYAGLCQMRLHDAGVLAVRDITLDSTPGLHSSGRGERWGDWRKMARSRRMAELDREIGHQRWRGAVVADGLLYG